MGMFDWDERFDLGVAPMNDQHHRLLELMAKLKEKSEAQVGHAALVQALEELAGYTQQHFREEEAFMEAISYADLKSHSSIHKNLLEKLSDYHKSFKESDADTLPASFFNFLKLWLSSHILGVDRRYGDQAKRGAA